jgi:threonine dehydrogenase-like Zn-dependent dehydrogenase
VLQNLDHRGACGCEENTGDGAGILMQIPHAFLTDACAGLGFQLPDPGEYGVGMIFSPDQRQQRQQFEKIIERIVAEEGQKCLGWRKVPTDNMYLGETAKASEPFVRQVFSIGVGLGQSHGAYAEFVRIGATGAHRLPSDVNFHEGAMIEPLAVGLDAVDKARMERGATVLVIGAGPVGLSVMLWAKFLGARHVIVSDKAELRAKMAARFGATDAVDPSKALMPQVEAIAGRAPDIIFECVGAPGLINETMMMAPRNCKIVVAGVCQQMDMILPLVGIVKELTLQFVLGYRPADFDYVIEMIAKDRVDVEHMITDVVNLDGLPAAFEALRKPVHQCKVMLEN